MDQRKEKATKARQMLVRELGRIFFSTQSLTKIELISACNVKLDGQWISRLIHAGILTSTGRGRNGAKYSLAPGIYAADLLAHADRFAAKLHNSDVETHNETRRQAKMWDYRREIKRLKAIIDALGGTY